MAPLLIAWLCIQTPAAQEATQPRSDTAIEIAALEQVRVIQKGQDAFKAGTGGYAPNFHCLVSPDTCDLGYEVLSRMPPTYIPSGAAAMQRPHSYALEPGPVNPGARFPQNYTVTAVPVNGVGTSFTANNVLICSRSDGQMPAMADGKCVAPAAVVK